MIRLAYPVMFLLLTFSGAIRNLTESEVMKQALFCLPLLLPGITWALLASTRSGKFPASPRSLPAYLFLLALMAANPLNTSLLHGLAGWLLHSAFWLILGNHLNSPKTPATSWLIPAFAVSCLVQIVTGTVQYLDSAQMLFIPLPESVDVPVNGLVGNALRATGTFSHTSGFAAFGVFSVFPACYFLKRDRIGAGMLTALSGLYICLISGSRYAALAFLFVLALYSCFELPFRRQFSLLLLAAGICLILLLKPAFPDPAGVFGILAVPLQNFMARVDASQAELNTRVIADLTDPIAREFPFRLLGAGLGSTYQGMNGSYGTSTLIRMYPNEGELFRLVLEGGWLLLLGRFILLAALLGRLSFTRPFAAGLFLLLGFFSPLSFNCYSSIYLALGLVLIDSP